VLKLVLSRGGFADLNWIKGMAGILLLMLMNQLFALLDSLTLAEGHGVWMTNLLLLFFFSWNEAYLVEKKNFNEYGDVGEVWFGENSALMIVR
jgi:hypothetical protein